MYHNSASRVFNTLALYQEASGAILKERRQGKLTNLTDLQKLGIRAPEQAAPYILFDGHRATIQMSLF